MRHGGPGTTVFGSVPGRFAARLQILDASSHMPTSPSWVDVEVMKADGVRLGALVVEGFLG